MSCVIAAWCARVASEILIVAAGPAHTKLLGAGIPVCEHMTGLAAVPHTGARLHAVPIAWVGGATFPVRAYVIAAEDPSGG